MANLLNADILFQIVDNLRDCTQVLREIALTSSLLRDHARRYLFRHLQVTVFGRHGYHEVEYLRDRPYMTNNTIRLSIRGSAALISQYPTLDAHILYEFLHVMTHLQELRIANIRWDNTQHEPTLPHSRLLVCLFDIHARHVGVQLASLLRSISPYLRLSCRALIETQQSAHTVDIEAFEVDLTFDENTFDDAVLNSIHFTDVYALRCRELSADHLPWLRFTLSTNRASLTRLELKPAFINLDTDVWQLTELGLCTSLEEVVVDVTLHPLTAHDNDIQQTILWNILQHLPTSVYIISISFNFWTRHCLLTYSHLPARFRWALFEPTLLNMAQLRLLEFRITHRDVFASWSLADESIVRLNLATLTATRDITLNFTTEVLERH